MTAPLICILGPTASGKSALAMALAQHWPVEIISMDSAQVFRGMDIGTAKPTAAEQAAVPHQLIDILDPAERYSAAQFASDATAQMAAIAARGRLPVLVGGTFLYLRALLEGLSELPPADQELRQRLLDEAATQGWPELHARLQRHDPDAAARIHPHDAQRIQRALEVQELSGRSRSAHFAVGRASPWPGPVLKLAVTPDDRALLRERIAQRFLAMIQAGFIDEVRQLHERGDLHAGLPSVRAVGYRQLWKYLDGEWDESTAVERGIIASRQYAKRQLTWLRAEPNLQTLRGSAATVLAEARRHIDRFLCGTAA